MQKRGSYTLLNLANLYQKPVPFVFEDNGTHNTEGADEISRVTGQSGLDKHQCTARHGTSY